MTLADWMNVIQQAAAHPTTTTVQFIGGEPSDHPAFAELVEYALLRGLQVAVFTNLFRVDERLWGLFARDGVKVSTSWYTADRAQHDHITGRPGSFGATWSNIARARQLGDRAEGRHDRGPGRPGPHRRRRDAHHAGHHQHHP